MFVLMQTTYLNSKHIKLSQLKVRTENKIQEDEKEITLQLNNLVS